MDRRGSTRGNVRSVRSGASTRLGAQSLAVLTGNPRAILTNLRDGSPTLFCTAMDSLPLGDQHHLRAAEGWLELGVPADAHAELDRIEIAFRRHPDVLHLRWKIHRKSKEWESCYEVAKALTETASDDPRAWTAMAQTFYYTQRIQEAYDLAVSKITRFPQHWPLYYDAACYACLTGRLGQARQFLQLAISQGDEEEITRLAAQDPDLKGLWESEQGAGS